MWEHGNYDTCIIRIFQGEGNNWSHFYYDFLLSAIEFIKVKRQKSESVFLHLTKDITYTKIDKYLIKNSNVYKHKNYRYKHLNFKGQHSEFHIIWHH